MAHAKLSASAASRWMNCPGSVRLIKDLEDSGQIRPDTSSDAAMEGTAAHHIAECCVNDMLAGGWAISAEKYLGCSVSVEPDGDGTELHEPGRGKADANPNWKMYDVTDDMVIAVDVFVRHIREVLESMGASEDGIPSDISAEVEAHADLSFLGRDDLGGRIDVRITQLLGDMHVIDYKHGRGIPVSPEKNHQLMIYGLGGDANADMMPEHVVLTIVQPRCPKNEAVDSWTIGAQELRDWGREVLLPAANLTDTSDLLNPGEKQCRWCRAAGHCDGAHTKALQVAAAEFEDIPEEPTAKNAKTAVMAMDMGKVLRILDMRDFIEGALKAATARVIGELEAGRGVEGWKLVASRSQRKWKADAEDALKRKRVPATVTHIKKLASFTVIEKARKGKYKGIVAELTEKPAGKPTLVPMGDKRPALPPPAHEDFDELPPVDDLLM